MALHYRKIYEQSHGPIPKDKDGRSYEIHHIDGNHKNDSLENLIALAIQEHYDIHQIQGDWYACLRIAAKMKLSPNELSKMASRAQQKRVANGTHPFLGGEIQERVSRQRVKDGTHNFLGGEIQKRSGQKRVKNRSHNFLGGEIGGNASREQVINRTHPFLGEAINKKLLNEGKHPSQQKKMCKYCGRTFSINTYIQWHDNNCKKRN